MSVHMCVLGVRWLKGSESVVSVNQDLHSILEFGTATHTKTHTVLHLYIVEANICLLLDGK